MLLTINGSWLITAIFGILDHSLVLAWSVNKMIYSCKVQNNLFHRVNCYTIEGFSYSHGKMSRSMFIVHRSCLSLVHLISKGC